MLGCQSWGLGFDSPWFHFHFFSIPVDSKVPRKHSLIVSTGKSLKLTYLQDFASCVLQWSFEFIRFHHKCCNSYLYEIKNIPPNLWYLLSTIHSFIDKFEAFYEPKLIIRIIAFNPSQLCLSLIQIYFLTSFLC